jgi:hypothetical protein
LSPFRLACSSCSRILLMMCMKGNGTHFKSNLVGIDLDMTTLWRRLLRYGTLRCFAVADTKRIRTIS